MNNLLEKIDLSSLENAKYLFELKAGFNKELAKFHDKVKPPSKNGHVDFTSKKGGRTKYDYVQLEDLIKAIDTALNGTGMTWSQDSEVDNGAAKVRTRILSSNGYEYVSPWIVIKTSGQAQDIGSAITYAKRYSLGTSFGINSETDDDGRKAQESVHSQNSNNNQNAKTNPGPVTRMITPKQLGEIKTKLIELGLAKGTSSDIEANNYLAMAKLKRLEYLTSDYADALLKRIEEDLEQAKSAEKKSNEFDNFLKGI
jgi:hypothetical protein